MAKDIQILVVDDHQVVREGIRHLLGQEEDMEFVGQAGNSEEVMSQVDMFSPNIVLMDIKMPGVDGIELTRQVKQKQPSCNIIMLTLYDEYLNQALEAGARGYLLKDIKREELAQAIRQVHHGEVVISDSIKSKTQLEYEQRPTKKAEAGPGIMIEEIQLVLTPPIEANQLMRFTGRAEETLYSRVYQVFGSWQEGTVMTFALNKAMSLADILSKFENMPEVEAVGEKPLRGQASKNLLKQIEEIPRFKNRIRETIFVTLEG